jgi:hypothetical protein
MTRRLALLLLLALSFPGLGFPARAELLALASPDGHARFARAEAGPAALSLLANLETEIYLTFCGPASLATVLNSLGIHEPAAAVFHPHRRVTQDSLFTAENLAVRSYSAVQIAGVTLDQLAQFARNLGTEAEATHADDMSVDALRDRIREALADPSSRVVLNYSRIPLGQEGDGHISPAAAYDAANDSVLILDVARYKYPPVWVPVPLLHTAMLRLDTESGRPRGLLILTARRAP